MATRAAKRNPPKGGRHHPPENESKREKFLRLGNPRVQRVLNSIRLVGNLASPNYQWTPDDINKMRTAIQGQLDKTLARFEKQDRSAPATFVFEEQF